MCKLSDELRVFTLAVKRGALVDDRAIAKQTVKAADELDARAAKIERQFQELQRAYAERSQMRQDLERERMEMDAIYEAAGNVYKYHMASQGEWPDALEDVLSPLWVLLVQRENMKESPQ